MKKVNVIVLYRQNPCENQPIEVYNVTVKHKSNNIDLTNLFNRITYEHFNDLYSKVLRVLSMNDFCVAYNDSFGGRMYDIDWINTPYENEVKRYYHFE